MAFIRMLLGIPMVDHLKKSFDEAVEQFDHRVHALLALNHKITPPSLDK